jgi:hypothetical protein
MVGFEKHYGTRSIALNFFRASTMQLTEMMGGAPAIPLFPQTLQLCPTLADRLSCGGSATICLS